MAAHNMTAQNAPNPMLIFDSLLAFQRSMALKGAIDLELFTRIAEGASTTTELASRCQASERGIRILCDFLTIQGFLVKRNSSYALTQDSGLFLDKRSPAYLGDAAYFLTHEMHFAGFRDIAAVVRKGGTINGEHGTVAPENPIWVEFARSMAPMAAMGSQTLAAIVARPGQKMKVLDVAAGHGMYGISVARHNPAAEITALDWKNVLEVAVENARRAGVSDRYRTIAGSAFEVDLGKDYDLVLIPNFLHHFDAPTNVALLKRFRAALRPGGQVATVEFVPNDDRITPPEAAAFSMVMLAGTPSGDAYTFRELEQMFRDAGFGPSTIQDLPPSPERLILTAV